MTTPFASFLDPATGRPLGMPNQSAGAALAAGNYALQAAQSAAAGNAAGAGRGAQAFDLFGNPTAGTFGWAQFDPAASRPMSAEDQQRYQRIQSGDPGLMNEYKQKYGANWFQQWGADQDRLTKQFTNQTTSLDTLNALGASGKSGQDIWNHMTLHDYNALRAATPEQRQQFLDQWAPGSYDRSLIEGSLARQGITVASGDTGVRWDGAVQGNSPVLQRVPADPFQQFRSSTPGVRTMPSTVPDQTDPFAPFAPQLAPPSAATPFTMPAQQPAFNTGVAPAPGGPAVDPAPPLNDGVAQAPPGAIITESATNMGAAPVAQSAGFAGPPSWGGSAPFTGGGGGFGGLRPVGGFRRGATGSFLPFFRPVRRPTQTVAGAATAAGGGAAGAY